MSSQNAKWVPDRLEWRRVWKEDSFAFDHHNKDKRSYILAFPGLGKSFLCYHNPKFYDADFGIFRKYTTGKTNKHTVKLFVDYLKDITVYESAVVLVNEPLLLDYLKIDKVCLPEQTIMQRCADKLGVTLQTCREWVQGWEQQARRRNVPIVYIRESLLWYFHFELPGSARAHVDQD